MSDASSYTVLRPGAEVVVELERKKSRFLTILRRTDSTEDAQGLVERLRKERYNARHHCSAWSIGPDRRIQRANDDGEPSGTAGAPMLEALTKAEMPSGAEDLSDATAVVVRWFGGTLLGAGGLVSAYSDSVLAALEEARTRRLFLTRRRMQQFQLAAPIAEAGRWENELRAASVTVLSTDYAQQPGAAAMNLAVPDISETVSQLQTQVATLSAGEAALVASGTEWVDVA